MTVLWVGKLRHWVWCKLAEVLIYVVGPLSNFLCDLPSEEQNQVSYALQYGVDNNLFLVPASAFNNTGLDQIAKIPLSGFSSYWLLGNEKSHNIHFCSLVLTNSELIMNLHSVVGYIQSLSQLLPFNSGRMSSAQLFFWVICFKYKTFCVYKSLFTSCMVLHCLVPLWKKQRDTELLLSFLLQQWYQLGIIMARFVNIVRKQQIKAVTIRRTGFLKHLQCAIQDMDHWVRTGWRILESRCIGNVLVIQEFKWEMVIST